MPRPGTDGDALAAPYWEGTREGKLRIQKCSACGSWQWGPEWICHRCHSFDLAWCEIKGKGLIYSYERPHHMVHPALDGRGPYIVVLVELPDYGNVRMIGNLLGDPLQAVKIGAPVVAVFEPHDSAEPPFTLVQWRLGTP
jgi:uncharacterized OB-fold protein